MHFASDEQVLNNCMHDGSIKLKVKTGDSTTNNSHCNTNMNGVSPNMINAATKPAPSEPAPCLEYLQELLKDKKQLTQFTSLFTHVDRLLESEINKVRVDLFHLNRGIKVEDLTLPEPAGVPETITQKVFIPIKDNPNYNFVGRLLGPGGMTAKHMEKSLGCKIMIRGQGSMRDKKKEDMNRGKPNWEHLNEELHVLISVEDTPNRSHIKMKKAVEEIQAFLDEAIKTPDGEDDIKKKQLMELALLNGTYRDMNRRPEDFSLIAGGIPGNPLSTALISDPTSMVTKANKALTMQSFLAHAGAASVLNPYLRSGFPPGQQGMPLYFGMPNTLCPQPGLTGIPRFATSSAGQSGAMGMNNPHLALMQPDPAATAAMFATYPEYMLSAGQTSAANSLFDYNMTAAALGIDSSAGILRSAGSGNNIGQQFHTSGINPITNSTIVHNSGKRGNIS